MKTERRYFVKRINYAVAAASEMAQPLLQWLGQTGVQPTPPESWRRGVLLGADHIGDVLYNTASLPHLRKGLPNCEWSYVASSPAAELLRNNPHIQQVIPRGTSHGDLRQRRFDVAICYNSGGYWRDVISARRAAIPNRVSYVHKGFSGLVTYPITISYPQPYPAYFRDLVAQLTGQPATWGLRPQVFSRVDDEAAVATLWNELRIEASRPTLACFVTTRQPTGIWPIPSFAETLHRLFRDHSVQVVLCGSEGDKSVLEQVRDTARIDCAIAAGRLSVTALALFLARCSAVLCPDSGPRHLANAANVPVFFFRNLRSSRAETGKYCESEVDLSPDAELVPPSEQIRYLAAVTPADVITAMLPKLRSSGIGPGVAANRIRQA